MSSKIVKSDFFWNTLGALLQNAISPILLLIVTRTNGIYDSGVFSFAFSVSIILWALGMWGGRTYQVSDTNGEFQQRSYIMVRVILSVVIFLVAVLFSMLNSYPGYLMAMILILTAFKACESLADAFYGVLQLNSRLYLSGISLTIKALIGLACFLIVDNITGSPLYASFSVLMVNMILLIVLDFRLVKMSDSEILSNFFTMERVRDAFKIMKRCASVFIVFFLALFSLNIPRYFIEKYNPDEVGYFGIIAMPITLVVLLITFILQPKIVPLSNALKGRQYESFFATVHNVLAASLVIGVGVLIITWLIGVELLGFIFGIDFSEYQSALIIIVIGGLASALLSVLLNIFVILRDIKLSLFVLITTNLILAGFSYFALQRAGVMIAVTLYAITNIIQGVVLFSKYNTLRRRMVNSEKN